MGDIALSAKVIVESPLVRGVNVSAENNAAMNFARRVFDGVKIVRSLFDEKFVDNLLVHYEFANHKRGRDDEKHQRRDGLEKVRRKRDKIQRHADVYPAHECGGVHGKRFKPDVVGIRFQKFAHIFGGFFLAFTSSRAFSESFDDFLDMPCHKGCAFAFVFSY